MARRSKSLALLLAAILQGEAAFAALVPAGSLTADWASAYVSEGRDQLDGADLFSSTALIEAAGLSFCAWYGFSRSADYRELNLTLERHFSLGPVQLSAGYTRLEYPGSDEPADNEFGLLLSFDLPSGLAAELGARYATEARGAFFEITVSRAWPLLARRLSLTPYLRAGFDAGYASPECDGPNHIEAGATIALPLRAGFSLSAQLVHCWPQRDVRASGQDEVTWGGAGVSFDF